MDLAALLSWPGQGWLLAALVAVGVCAILGYPAARRWPATPEEPRRRVALDALAAALLALLGLGVVHHLFQRVNPAWIPTAQDFGEYAAALAQVQLGDQLDLYWNRNMLFPWLASLGVRGLGLTPFDAAIHLSLVATGLGGAVVFLVLRQLAPRPLAVAGGLLTIHLPCAMERLGHISDYALTHLLLLLCVAASLLAIRRPRPWAFLLAGLALAGVLAASPKGLAVALVGLPLLLLALPIERPRRAVLALLALFAPIALGWWLYDRLGIDSSSLEWGVVGLKATWAETQGIRLDHADWGLPAQGGDPGSFRFGRAGALAGLPGTIGVMLRTPEDYPSLAVRAADSPAVIRQALGMSSLVPLLLAPLGCLLAARGLRSWRPRLLAPAFLLALLGSQLLGAHGVPLRAYYVVPVLALLPPLALAALWGVVWPLGARLGACSPRPLWGLVLLALLLLPGGSPVGHASALELVESNHFAFLGSPRPETSATLLRHKLAPGDVVLDATPWRLAVGGFTNLAPVQLSESLRQGAALRAEASDAERRFIVLECAFGHRFAPAAQRMAQALVQSGRAERWSACIYRDRQPGLPIALDAASLEGER